MFDGSLTPKDYKKRETRDSSRRKKIIFVVLLTAMLSLTVLYSTMEVGTIGTNADMEVYVVHAPIQYVRSVTRAPDVIEDYGTYVMMELTPQDAALLKARGIPVENAEYMEMVGVANYPFLVGARADIPSYLTVEKSQYLLVKFHGPIKEDWKNTIEQMGFQFKGYIPYNTFLVKGNWFAVEDLKKLPYVEYVGVYQPAYRIQPQLLKEKGMIDVQIMLDKDANILKISKSLVSLGAQNVMIEKGVYNDYILARITPSVMYTVAKYDGVIWIQRKPTFVIVNDVAHGILQGANPSGSVHPLWDHGLWGEGQIIGESDTGIDYDHTMFRDTTGGTFHTPKKDHPQDYPLDNLPPPDTTHRKIVHYWTYVDGADTGSSEHGTHVAGSIAGNATGYSSSDAQYNGEAPSAKLSFVDIGDSNDNLYTPSDLNYLWYWMYNDGARISSQSWGVPISAGSWVNTYDSQAMQVDQFMWNHPDFLIFFAAGNDGSNANTVSTPSTAKDCVTVGALGSASSYGGGSETMQDIASFSSRGPTADGRLKPTIVSPGVAIDSAKGDGDPTTNNSGTTQMQGTSMATPNAAGVAALVREYFTDGYYPAGEKGKGYAFVPSGALIKAMLVNSADQATGSGAADHPYNGMTFPNNDQGFGRPSVKNVTYFPGSSRKLLVFDHGLDGVRGIGTGEVWERKVVVSGSGEDFKVTLAWTDYPGTPGASTILVNDLDLVVIAPDGTEYHGNDFTGSSIGSVYSTAGSTKYDRTNPVEEVWVNNPTTGTWTIRVVGYNVPIAQPFAVVVTGDLDTNQAIELDKPIYSDSDTVTVKVIDFSASGTVTAHVVSDSDSTGIDVTLTETASGSHIFMGTFQTTSSGEAGKLQVADGDKITATYGSAEATAIIDASAPVIANLHAEKVLDTTAHVVWSTNDYTNYSLWYGATPGSYDTFVGNSSTFLTGLHDVFVMGLQPNTTYYVKVSAWDRVGHRTDATFSFTTNPRADVLLVDDDKGDNWQVYDEDALIRYGWSYSLWDYAHQGRPTLQYLQQYKVVVWDTADGYPPIDDDDITQVLQPYLDNGGRLMMIGQDVGWAAFDTQNSPWATTTAQDFCQNYLHFKWNADDVSGGSQPLNISGVSGDPVGDGIANDMEDAGLGWYPDDISNNGGVVAINYNTGSSTKDAVIRYDDSTYRTVFVPFAFQDITSAYMRAKFMNQSVVYLLAGNLHPGVTVTSPNGGETLSGTVTITWDESDDSGVAKADVYYSDDGGNTWHYIGTAQGAARAVSGSNSIQWDTTQVPNGNNYLIKVIVYDDNGVHVYDTSDSVFQVYNEPVPEFGDMGVTILVLFFVAALLLRKKE